MSEPSTNNKVKPCKACGKEVAKAAKKCPHCGQKLKMGIFVKLIIGFCVIGFMGAILSTPTKDELAELQQSPVSDLSPGGELEKAFRIISDYTDLQRENIEKDIKGKIVQWHLPVFEVDKLSEGVYQIQTSEKRGAVVGTFAKIYTQSDDQVKFLENLKTNDMIKFKGRIKETTLRNVDIDPAILVQ